MNTEFFGAQLGERSASTTGGVSVLIRQLLGRAICCQNADYRRQAVPLRSSRCLNKQPGEPSLQLAPNEYGLSSARAQFHLPAERRYCQCVEAESDDRNGTPSPLCRSPLLPSLTAALVIERCAVRRLTSARR